MWRILRIVALLFILAIVAQGAWIARGRTTEWNNTVRVTIYPINGDHSAAAGDYVGRLDAGRFEPIEAFFKREAAGYGMAAAKPIEISLAPPVAARPACSPVCFLPGVPSRRQRANRVGRSVALSWP